MNIFLTGFFFVLRKEELPSETSFWLVTQSFQRTLMQSLKKKKGCATNQKDDLFKDCMVSRNDGGVKRSITVTIKGLRKRSRVKRSQG